MSKSLKWNKLGHPISVKDFAQTLRVSNAKHKKLRLYETDPISVDSEELVLAFAIAEETEDSITILVRLATKVTKDTMAITDHVARHMLRSMLTRWQQTTKLAAEYEQEERTRDLHLLYDGMQDALRFEIVELLNWFGYDYSPYSIKHWSKAMLQALDY